MLFSPDPQLLKPAGSRAHALQQGTPRNERPANRNRRVAPTHRNERKCLQQWRPREAINKEIIFLKIHLLFKGKKRWRAWMTRCSKPCCLLCLSTGLKSSAFLISVSSVLNFSWHKHYLGCLIKMQTTLSFRTFWASLVAQLVKSPPAMWETRVRSLSWEDPLEKGKAPHFSILAWRIPWTI